MKLTALLLTAGFLNVSAKAVSQEVSFSGERVPLETIFRTVSRQTGFLFLYPENVMADAKPVSIRTAHMPVLQFIAEVFKGQPLLKYHIINKSVFVSTMEMPAVIVPRDSVRHVEGIRGRIVGEDGKPIPNVSVVVKGKPVGTSSDNEGRFMIDAKVGDRLLASSVGFESREVRVTGSDITIVLKVATSKLDDVQVIAYGTTTTRMSVSNVTTVKASEIAKSLGGNVLTALQGRVPGLFVVPTTGFSGGGIKTSVQGVNSLRAGVDPFYVVDGVPYASQMLPNLGVVLGTSGNGLLNNALFGNPLNYINPSDIESITVLKDADATAIYGSRAANGAILITTKKGSAGAMKLDLNMQQGWGKVVKLVDLLDTRQYLEMRHEAKRNDNADVGPTDYDINGVWDTTRYTDWQKMFLRNTAKYSNWTASVSGGSHNTNYILSATFHRETSVFSMNDEYDNKKGALHFSINSVSPNNRIKLQFTANYLVGLNRLPNSDLTPAALSLPPNAPALYNADGSLNWALNAAGSPTWDNPMAAFYTSYRNKTNNLVANGNFSYELLPGLEFRTSLGYTAMDVAERIVTPLKAIDPRYLSTTGRSGQYSSNSSNSYILEPQLNYKLRTGAGQWELLAGTTIQQTSNNANQINASGFYDDAALANYNNASILTPGSAFASVYRYNALFGRLNYSHAGKYIVNLTMRRDGSSRFGAKNRFHNFGSVGAGWIFSSEPFVKDRLSFLSFGKLKANYGFTGNDQIGEYSYLDLYTPYGVAVPYRDVSAIYPVGFYNPYLQWEDTRKLSVGLDLTFFNNRWTLGVNYNRNRSSNLLGMNPVPPFTGFGYVPTNIPAVVQNTGIELTTAVDVVRSKRFKWNVSANVTVPRNKLISYKDLEKSPFSSVYILGEPISMLTTFKFMGVDPKTGYYLFRTRKGEITSGPLDYTDDRTEKIKLFPMLYGGMTHSFTYGSFDLSLLFTFTSQQGYNNFFGVLPGFRMANQYAQVMDRWRQPGDIASHALFTTGAKSESYYYGTVSDKAYSNASYIRLKNLSLSWSTPEKWTRSLHAQTARVYVQAQNLLTLTRFVGLDPETGSSTSLPPLRIVTLGIQIAF